MQTVIGDTGRVGAMSLLGELRGRVRGVLMGHVPVFNASSFDMDGTEAAMVDVVVGWLREVDPDVLYDELAPATDADERVDERVARAFDQLMALLTEIELAKPEGSAAYSVEFRQLHHRVVESFGYPVSKTGHTPL